MKNELTYHEKKKIADHYLYSSYCLCWNDLPDINSLHDAETKKDIINLCDERVNDF